MCNGLSTPIELFGQVDECVDCAIQSITNGIIAAGDNNTALALTSIYAYRLELRQYNQSLLGSNTTSSANKSCHLHVHLDEYGVYVLNVGYHPNCGGVSSRPVESICDWRQVKPGSSSSIPLVVLLATALVGFPLLLLLAPLLLKLVTDWTRVNRAKFCFVAAFLPDLRTSSTDARAGGDAAEDGDQKTSRRPRVRSVDVLRGIAIVIMIFTFNFGGAYAFLDHSVWNGIHLSDLALPSFIFVMGLSIGITNSRDARLINDAIYGRYSAFEEVTHSTDNNRKRLFLEFANLIYRIARRSLILFAIGITLTNGFFVDFEKFIFFDVLQRLSLTYLITSLSTLPVLLRYAPLQTNAADVLNNKFFWDITRFWPEWIPILALVALQTGLEYGINPANWNASSVVSMKDCPRGYLGPGGLHWNGSYENCTGGAHLLLDLYVFGENHLDEY